MFWHRLTKKLINTEIVCLTRDNFQDDTQDAKRIYGFSANNLQSINPREAICVKEKRIENNCE